MSKTILAKFLNPSPPTMIFSGWLEWMEVEYSLCTVGVGKLYTVHGFKIPERQCGMHGKIPIPAKPEPTLEDFLALNAATVDAEISRRVMKAAGQKPDDDPRRNKIDMKSGTPTFPEL